MRNLILFVVAIFLAWTKATTAQIAPVSPFNGALIETWESFPNFNMAGTVPNGTSVFGGAATISNSGSGQLAIYEPSAGVPFGIGSFGAQVHDGSKGAAVGPPSNFVTITFNDPISDFGAYWAAFIVGSEGDSIMVSFRTLGGLAIGTQTFQYAAANGALQWAGWHSIVPIESISFTSRREIVFDGLQANTVVPEPSSLRLCICGGLVGLVLAARRLSRPRER